MDPIVNYYHVNLVGKKFNRTRKTRPQMRTMGYNGLNRLYD